MSWVEYDDAGMGPVVIELQPTVLEVFRARVDETHRIHLRMLTIQHEGPDGQGRQRVRLGAATRTQSLLLTVPDPWWGRVWPLLEQARTQQHQFLGY